MGFVELSSAVVELYKGDAYPRGLFCINDKNKTAVRFEVFVENNICKLCVILFRLRILRV